MAITTALTFSGLLVSSKTLALIYFPYKTKDPVDIVIEEVFKKIKIHLCSSSEEIEDISETFKQRVGFCLDNIPISYLLYTFLKTKNMSCTQSIKLLSFATAMLSIFDLARVIFSLVLPQSLGRFIARSYKPPKERPAPPPPPPQKDTPAICNATEVHPELNSDRVLPAHLESGELIRHPGSQGVIANKLVNLQTLSDQHYLSTTTS